MENEPIEEQQTPPAPPNEGEPSTPPKDDPKPSLLDQVEADYAHTVEQLGFKMDLSHLSQEDRISTLRQIAGSAPKKEEAPPKKTTKVKPPADNSQSLSPPASEGEPPLEKIVSRNQRGNSKFWEAIENRDSVGQDVLERMFGGSK